jgi:hypothetical protein
MIVLDWSPNLHDLKIGKRLKILKWWKIVKSSMKMINRQMCWTCWSYEPLCVYVECISNIDGCSGSFHVYDPYSKIFYFVFKWAKVRKLPCFTSIMLYFKTVVATPGIVPPLSLSLTDSYKESHILSQKSRLNNAYTLCSIAPKMTTFKKKYSQCFTSVIACCIYEIILM